MIVIRAEIKNRLCLDHFYCLAEGNPILTKEGFNGVILCVNCNSKKWKFPPDKFFTSEEINQIKLINDKIFEELKAKI